MMDSRDSGFGIRDSQKQEHRPQADSGGHPGDAA